jgi:MauM/NapG family ferredoxin protein
MYVRPQNRRDFLKNVFTLGEQRLLKLRVSRKSEWPIRPPGACPEEEFLILCNRCGECEKACPEGTISIARSDSGEVVGIPVLHPEKHPCTFCMECVRACPTEALLESRGTDIGKAVILEERCIAWKGGGCLICRERCQTKAISWRHLRSPLIQKERCSGCGECAYVCPVSPKAIEILPFDDV